MAMQTQGSDLVRKFGARIAAANEQHKDAPIDLGFMRLPPGIRDGIAKLQVMEWGKYKDDKMGQGMKGADYFRAAAVVVHPIEHNGMRVANTMSTTIMIPMCDVPAKGQRKASTFEDNFFDYQNLFKMLGIAPCPHTKGTDPTGAQIIAYFDAAARILTDPQRPPTYVSFSTRGWTPPRPANWKQGDPEPEMMVFETWHGIVPPERVALLNGQYDPAAGASDAPPSASTVNTNTTANHQTPPIPSNETFNEPPQGVIDPRSVPRTQIQTPALSTQPTMFDGPTNAQIHAPPADESSSQPQSLEDEVTYLVAIAMDDPNGETDEGAAAGLRLEELAVANGWTKKQTTDADNWEQVGDMALSPPESAVTNQRTNPTIGSKHKFAKRGRDGERLKNNKGEAIPPQEVEVTSVDEANKTCTVKTVKDNKDVVDIRSKKPVPVKWEWLE